MENNLASGGLPVLICGAGPTGLVLALWLAKRKLPLRIIDKAARSGTASRALVVQARTLEFYRQLGIADSLLGRAPTIRRLRLWVRQRLAGVVRFGTVATGISPYPYFTVYPQDEHEALLEEILNRLGVYVERETELIGFEERPDGIHARLARAGGGTETVLAAYLAGCDGARSKVREILGAGFPGGTYEHTFYVADIAGSGPVINGDLNLALDEADFLAVFPMRGEGRARLIGTVRGGDVRGAAGASAEPLRWEDVSQDILHRLRLDIGAINWFSTYRVHHRVASFFRRGRAFLLGDAAHVHSPVGGQGMNTGIGDAVNLAWKLEAVLRRSAPESLLDTYEQERIPFAKSLVNTTDRAFAFVNRRGGLARVVRTRLVPLLLPPLFRSQALRRAAFRLVSQTRIHYRKSALSEGSAHGLHGGDRLPWSAALDNYGPLDALDWQVHCYGPAPAELGSLGIPVHSYPSSGGVFRDMLCLVRPDGYIGWMGRIAGWQELQRYASRWRITAGSST